MLASIPAASSLGRWCWKSCLSQRKHVHVAVLVCSILPLSLGWPSCSLLPAKPSLLLFLAPALPGGRARVPSLSESAQMPGKWGEKKLLLVAEKFPSCGVAEEWGQLGWWHQCCGEAGGWDQTDPMEPGRGWGCACQGLLPQVVPTGAVWSSAGCGPGCSPSPERSLCAQGFP